MNGKKGEVATIITIGTVIILGISILLPQLFGSKNKIYKTKAAESAFNRRSCEGLGGWFCAGECADKSVRANYEGVYGTSGKSQWYRDKAVAGGFDPAYCESANIKCTSGWYCYQDDSCLSLDEVNIWTNTYAAFGNGAGFNQWIKQKEESVGQNQCKKYSADGGLITAGTITPTPSSTDRSAASWKQKERMVAAGKRTSPATAIRSVVNSLPNVKMVEPVEYMTERVMDTAKAGLLVIISCRRLRQLKYQRRRPFQPQFQPLLQP
ncbi:hypothetical protein HY214_04080 [Candidatus Roizmanbacteria bacterium]|nr:hypothetical protein [Candidatus Roizmanbacteria bacterium]